MFNSKPIITRREEKIIIKYLKRVNDLEKQLREDDKNTPLGFGPQTMELMNRLGEARNNLHEIMKTIYLDK